MTSLKRKEKTKRINLKTLVKNKSMKKMFRISYLLIMWIGFVLFLFMISFGVFSFVYFNHDLNRTLQIKEVEILDLENVKKFKAYGSNPLRIEVEFIQDNDENYLLMYSYYYFDFYKDIIHMLVFDEKIIVTIDENGISCISKY